MRLRAEPGGGGRGSAVPSRLVLAGLAPGARLELPESEAHHAVRVCRARVGDAIEATDGSGTVARVELESVAPAIVRVVALDRVPRPAEAWVLCGAPESGRADWLVEKLAELGVAQFVPLECARGDWRGTRIERWQRLADAALRQSRRAWRLAVSEPVAFDAALARVPAGAVCWLASAEGAVAEVAGMADATAAVAVGPASGFSDAELNALRSCGFREVRLADARLRTETAAIAWAARWAARP